MQISGALFDFFQSYLNFTDGLSPMGSSLSSSLEEIPPSKGQNGAPIDVSQELRDLEEGHVLVEKVSWRRAPMAEKTIFYHDYVLIEVNKINLANNVVDRSVGWIKAEKTYDDDGRGQIPIQKLTRLDQPVFFFFFSTQVK